MKRKNIKTADFQEIAEILKNLTLFDDIFMSRVFDKNISATKCLLRAILGREDLEIKSVVGQKELKNPEVEGRNLRLDILAEDREGKPYNIEVQRDDEGADEHRARFHSAMLDARLLKKGEKFKEMPESYVIFITENDYFEEGLPLYTVDRAVKETGKEFADGCHIIYVNGAYRGDDDIGRLMHDFSQENVENMYNKELADGVKHFKEKGEYEDMCSKLEEWARKREMIAVEKAVEEATRKAEEKAEKKAKDASLITTITVGIAYGIDKERIIDRLCSEFKLTKKMAEKKYEKYAVKTA